MDGTTNSGYFCVLPAPGWLNISRIRDNSLYRARVGAVAFEEMHNQLNWKRERPSEAD